MSNQNLKIREAVLDDLDIIVKFNCNLAKETEDMELNTDIVTRGVRSVLIDHSKGKYHVCTVDDKVVGQIMYTYEWSDWRNGTFLWIQSVYVDQEHRRKGVFKSLYNHIKEICDNDKTIAGMRLYVEKENTTAKSTYNSLGMKDCYYEMYEY